MKSKLSLFRLVILGSFLAFSFLGFLLFATYKNTEEGRSNNIGSVEIWGTLDTRIVNKMLSEISNRNEYFDKVTYIELRKETYENDILEAIAAGQAPDLILVSNESIYKNLNKVYTIPYKNFSKRTFLDTYPEAFDIFLSNDGITAVPFIIDPLVMYYNKPIFSTAAVAIPPKGWSDLFTIAPKIVELDEKENIKRAVVSMGEVLNVENYKAIISTLLLQTRSEIVTLDNKGRYSAKDTALNEESIDALLFYNEFSNQLSKNYSWNRSLPNSKNFFLGGKLAIYFGFASELTNLRLKNPNLNFDVAEIPFVEGEGLKTVFANTWAFAIPKTSDNITGAFNAALEMSSKEAQEFVVSDLHLPPVRRDLLNQGHEDPFMDIFYREAIYASSYVDPNWEETDKIFSFMIDSVNGGRQSPREALDTAFSEIDILLK